MIDWGACSSLLFVPGHRADRVAKAVASGADVVCIDLEDAVPASEKGSARSGLVRDILPGLSQADRNRVVVRINAITTRFGLDDILALADGDAMPSAVMLPKAQTPGEFDILSAAFGDGAPDFVALVESIAGMDNAATIAAHPGVKALMLGVADLSGELGCKLAWEPLLASRAALVRAGARNGKTLIDGPCLHLDDDAELARETTAARDLGFHMKAALHPKQLPDIHRVFRPSDDDVAFARRALEAFEAGGGEAIRFEGQMMEAPLVRRLRDILSKEETANA